MADDHFLTTEEVLGYLRINLRTIYRLIRTGKLPAFRVGRHWRFRKEDIDAWLAARHARGIRFPTHTPPRVLIVDDEPSVRDMIAKALRGRYAVETAEDGTAALEILRESDFDLLITDLRMPGMDGLALIRAARRYAPDLPVVVVTAYSSEATAIEAINLGGVSGYLTKPFRVERIRRLAARALGHPVRMAHTE
jgi:excisionase family DNA binding protein